MLLSLCPFLQTVQVQYLLNFRVPLIPHLPVVGWILLQSKDNHFFTLVRVLESVRVIYYLCFFNRVSHMHSQSVVVSLQLYGWETLISSHPYRLCTWLTNAVAICQIIITHPFLRCPLVVRRKVCRK